MSTDDAFRVGAHASIAGGVQNAVDEQIGYGGNCGQIFSSSPQVWAGPSIDEEDATEFRALTIQYGVSPWVIHTSYLVNLCTPKDGLREKSLSSMQEEVDTAARLGIDYVNVHLGAHTGAGVAGGLENAVSVLDDIDIPDGVTILIESDAGSGTKLGGQFWHLGQVCDESRHDIEVCVDTAHAWAAGYDLSTANGVEETIQEFENEVGLDRLACFHLNDSKHERGTNKDEHAHIGLGEIGESGMHAVVNHPDIQDVPFVLETPSEDGKSFQWNVEQVEALRES
jgi:deoxyribonuclease-4